MASYKGVPVYLDDDGKEIKAKKKASVEFIEDTSQSDWNKLNGDTVEDVDMGRGTSTEEYLGYTKVMWSGGNDKPLCTIGLFTCSALVVAVEVVREDNGNFLGWSVGLHHLAGGSAPNREVYLDMVEKVEAVANEHGRISHMKRFLIPGSTGSGSMARAIEAIGKFHNDPGALYAGYAKNVKALCVLISFTKLKNNLVVKAYQVKNKATTNSINLNLREDVNTDDPIQRIKNDVEDIQEAVSSVMQRIRQLETHTTSKPSRKVRGNSPASGDVFWT